MQSQDRPTIGEARPKAGRLPLGSKQPKAAGSRRLHTEGAEGVAGSKRQDELEQSSAKGATAPKLNCRVRKLRKAGETAIGMNT